MADSSTQSPPMGAPSGVESDEERLSREAFGRFVRVVRWPLLVLGLLAVHHTMMFIGLTTALGMPGYYATTPGAESGMRWDDLQELRRRSRALGWRLGVTVSEAPDPLGQRRATFRLEDSAGAPLPGVGVSATLYHHARPQRPVEVCTRTGAAGEWATPLSIHKTGIWRVRIEAVRGADRCLLEHDLWLRPGAVLRAGEASGDPHPAGAAG